jgi:hypothetical protein
MSGTGELYDALEEIRRLRELNAELVEALDRLRLDVQDYEPWQRPCYALDKAMEALAKAEKLR